MQKKTQRIFDLALSCSLCPGLLLGLGVTGVMASAAIANSARASASAADGQTSSTPEMLTRFEDQLLECSYPKEPVETRLARLEQFVFGSKSTGPIPDRMQALSVAIQNAAPKNGSGGDAVSSRQDSSSVQNSGQSSASTPGLAPPLGANTPVASSYGDLGFGSYPRVTQLEQQLLGKTYVSDPLPKRVSRLEMKQFGKVTPGDDYGDRIDQLDQAVPRSPTTANNDADEGQTYSAAPANAAPGSPRYAPVPTPYAGANPAGAPRSAAAPNGIPVAPSFQRPRGATGSPATAYVSTTDSLPSQQEQEASGDYGRYPRVSALEQKVFGLTYEKDSLPVRIARLEEKEFGKASPDDDYGERIDRLDKKVKPKTEVAHDDQDSGSSSGSGSGRGSMGGTIGRALVGLLGSAIGGGGGGIGGIGGGGMGMGPGMGMGMMGLGRGLATGPTGSGIGYGVNPRGQGGNGQSQAGNSAAAPPAPVIQNPFAAGSLPVNGIEDRTDAMEKFVFGRHSERPLEERVARLEKKLAPWEHHEGNQDLTARVNHLWSILAAANSRQSKNAVAGKQDLTH